MTCLNKDIPRKNWTSCYAWLRSWEGSSADCTSRAFPHAPGPPPLPSHPSFSFLPPPSPRQFFLSPPQGWGETGAGEHLQRLCPDGWNLF